MIVKRWWVLLVLLVVGPWWVGRAAAQDSDEPQSAAAAPMVGWLELSGELIEGQVPFAWMADADAGRTLSAVLDQLHTVETGDRYIGLVIYLDAADLRLTQIHALGRAIRDVRAAGRTVLVFAESYAMSDYLLASYADRILLQHKGGVVLAGLSIEELYLTGLLDKIGIRADLEQIGKFKGANEELTRYEPSEPWNQNIASLLDDLYDQVITTVAQNRGVSREQVEQWLAGSWTMTDTDLVEAKLVDQRVGRDLIDATELAFGDDFLWDDEMGLVEATMRIDSPFAIFSMMFKSGQTQTQRPTIAVIHADGPITSGESAIGAGLFTDQTIGSRTLVRALGEVRDDENILGAVIQIDSPGGSALASDVIWQAVRKTTEEKPVYVSIGPMAASGGYYVAVAGDQVYVHPQSVVGSIGVVSGKFVLGNLYAKLGINVTQRDRGPLAGIYNSVNPFTIEQRRVVRAAMQNVYDQFVERVRMGRGSRLENIDAVAEGRLFTGRAAVDNGMADKVGTLEQAVADLAASLELDDGQYDVLHLPPAMTLEEYLTELFEVRSRPIGLAAPAELELARQLLGPAAWSAARRSLAGLMLLRDEPVLTLMPQVIVIK